MKVFFALLLIVNIAFAVFQWLLPYEQLFVEKKKIPAGEQLQLLTNANVAIISESEVVSEVEAEKEVAAVPGFLETEDASERLVCYTIGPFTDKARAIEISGRYSGNRARTALKSSLEKQYLGVMVYISGHKTRGAAITTANKLSAKGIRDHIIVNHPEQPNLLSLGVFGLKKNADRLKSRVVKLGFPAESESRYRERTIFWLYVEQSSEAELLQLVVDDEFDSGISQIPTQCLPT
jgi:acyl CoA:acetate/3-ketoacid CoA transferase alpha subunit